MFGRNLGLGIILTAKDMMSGPVKSASASIRNLTSQTTAQNTAFKQQSEQIRNNVEKYRELTKFSVGVAGVGAAMMAPLVAAGVKSAKFDQRMKDIKALIITLFPEKEANRQIDGLTESILDLGMKTPIPLDQAAQAAWELVSANLTVAETQAALPHTANMAIAAMGDMTVATNFMSMALNTYGRRWGDALTATQKAEKISNVVSEVSSIFQTDMFQMENAARYGIGVASMAGTSFEEWATLMGIAQTRGLKNTLAGTSYAAYVRALTQMKGRYGQEIDASDRNMSWSQYFDELAGGAKIQKNKGSARAKMAAKVLDITIEDEKGMLLPYWRILEQIEQRLGVTPEKAAKAAKAIKEMGNDESISGLEVLDYALKSAGVSTDGLATLQAALGDEGSRFVAMTLGQSQLIREQTKIVEQKSDADLIAKTRMEGLVLQWDRFKNRIDVVTIRLGALLEGVFGDLLDKLSIGLEMLNSWIKLNPDKTKWIVYGVGITGALLLVAGALGAVMFLMLQINSSLALISLANQAAIANGAVGMLGTTTAWTTIRMTAWNVIVGISTGLTGILTRAWIGFNAVVSATPFGWIMISIWAIIMGLTLLITNFDSVKAAWKGAMKWEKNMLMDIKDWLDSLSEDSNIIARIFGGLFDIAKFAFNRISELPLFKQLLWIFNKIYDLSGVNDPPTSLETITGGKIGVSLNKYGPNSDISLNRNNPTSRKIADYFSGQRGNKIGMMRAHQSTTDFSTTNHNYFINSPKEAYPEDIAKAIQKMEVERRMLEQGGSLP